MKGKKHPLIFLNLEHLGGAAKAISDAAGEEFAEE